MTTTAPRPPRPPDAPGDSFVCLVQQAASGDRVITLTVRIPGRTAHVVAAVVALPEEPGGPRAHVGLLPHGAAREHWGGRLPPGTIRRRERERALESAEVLTLGDGEIHLRQDDQLRVVRAHTGRLVVTDEPKGLPLGKPLADVLVDDPARGELEARGLRIARALATESVVIQREVFVKILDAARKRLDRRREAVTADLGRISEADQIAAQAQWLVAEAARAKRGASKLVVTDWSTGEPVTKEIPLDPSKSARTQVEAMFRRAKRLRLGARIAEERLAQATKQRDAVIDALERVRAAETLAEMEAAATDAKRAAPKDVALPRPGADPAGAKPSKRASSGTRTAYRTFLATSGTKLLVGKGAADNDALTTKTARPHDLWLHAKDRTGAHVIVVLEKGHTCSGPDLVDAAHLAAHFSDVREEKVVDVQYAERRHVRKPKGSPPGLVIVDREKVLVLRVEPERIRALLEREDVDRST
jgi:hypothetical protein